MSNLIIQSTISGYSGTAVTLMSVLDENTGILVVAKSIEFREDRSDEAAALISNLDLPDLDKRFTDDMLRDAIRSYFTRSAQGTISILDQLNRFRPDNQIEKESVDERGQKYRLNADISNGQVAVLAAVAMADLQRGSSAAIAFMDELADLYTIQTI